MTRWVSWLPPTCSPTVIAMPLQMMYLLALIQQGLEVKIISIRQQRPPHRQHLSHWFSDLLWLKRQLRNNCNRTRSLKRIRSPYTISRNDNRNHLASPLRRAGQRLPLSSRWWLALRKWTGRC